MKSAEWVGIKFFRGLKLASLLFVLSACGGGGGNDNGSLSTSVPITSKSLVVGPASLLYLSIVDPTQPTAPVLTDSEVRGYWRQFIFKVDSVNQKRTFGGKSRLFYVKAGKVFRHDIDGLFLSRPQQISSITSACGVINGFPLEASGEDGWLHLEAVSPGDNCETGSRFPVYVRFNAPAHAAAVRLPNDYQLRESLLDSSGERVQLFLAWPASGNRAFAFNLQTLTPDLTSAGELQGATFNASDWPILSPDSWWRKNHYVKVGNELRQLSWTNSGAMMKPSIYYFSQPFVYMFYENGADLYWVDGTNFYRSQAGGLPQMLASGFPITSISLNNDRFFLANSSSVWELPVSGGEAVQSVKTSGNSELSLLGLTNESIVYFQGKDSFGEIYQWRRGAAAPTLIANNVNYPREVIKNFEYRRDVVGVYWCESAGRAGNCSAGYLKYFNISEGNVYNIGRFPDENRDKALWDPFFNVMETTIQDLPVLLVPGVRAFPSDNSWTSEDRAYIFEVNTPNSLTAAKLH